MRPVPRERIMHSSWPGSFGSSGPAQTAALTTTVNRCRTPRRAWGSPVFNLGLEHRRSQVQLLIL